MQCSEYLYLSCFFHKISYQQIFCELCKLPTMPVQPRWLSEEKKRQRGETNLNAKSVLVTFINIKNFFQIFSKF